MLVAVAAAFVAGRVTAPDDGAAHHLPPAAGAPRGGDTQAGAAGATSGLR